MRAGPPVAADEPPGPLDTGPESLPQHVHLCDSHLWRVRKGGPECMRAIRAATAEPPGPLYWCWLFCRHASCQATLA